MNFSVFASVAGILAAAYLIGSIPFGYIIGKCHGKDIRKEGSGNIGATNVTRVIGKWWGKLCFLLDFLKGAICVFAAMKLIGMFPATFNGPNVWLPAVTAFAVVAGHIWPVWLGFKGGKGVATAAGALTGLSWPAVVTALIVWVIVFKLWRYVSLASIIAAIVLPFAAFIYKRTGIFTHISMFSIIFIFILSALAIGKHASNIQRLLRGTENRFESGAKK